MDNLNQALDVLESRNDHLLQEAKQLVKDAMAARDPTVGGPPGEGGNNAGKGEITDERGDSEMEEGGEAGKEDDLNLPESSKDQDPSS